MTGFNFDEQINRRAVPALKWHEMVLGKGNEHLFPGSVADMDFKAPPVVLAAMQARLEHGVFGYEAVPGGLLPALAGWLKTRHGWAVEPAHILRAPSVLNSMAMAINTFTNAGDGLIVQPPVFFDFYDIAAENGRKIIRNPLIETNGHYSMDFADLEAKAADPSAKILLLCNPHNPVGRVWTPDELRRLGDICAAHNVLVISDEIHGGITFSGHPYTPFASLGTAYAENSVTSLSPAKIFNLASCGGAFTVVPEEVKRVAMQAANSALTVNKNNAFASVAMQAAYEGGGPWLDAALAYLEENARMVVDALGPTAVNTRLNDGTFLMWLDFRALGLSPDDLHSFLREKARMQLTRGIAFGAEGAGFARLNIACPRPRLRRAVAGLVEALAAS
jgi:cystathionine beta-lyase